LDKLIEAEDAITTAFQSACEANKFKNYRIDIEKHTIQFEEFRIFFV